MPQYEYYCPLCGRISEYRVSMTDPDASVRPCKHCQFEEAKLIPSIPAWRPDKTVQY